MSDKKPTPAEIRLSIVRLYIVRAINLCAAAGIIERVQQCNVTLSLKGEGKIGELDVTEEELRDVFYNMWTIGNIHESLEYEDVFSGVVSKGEVIH